MNKIHSSNFDHYMEQGHHGTPYFPFQAFSQEDNNGQYFAPYHWHEDMEILYVTKGSLLLHTEEETYSLKAGRVYFINPGTLHGLFGESTCSHHYALLFRPDFLSFSRYDICQNQFLDPLLSGQLLFPDGRNLSRELTKQLSSLIEEAALLYQQQTPIAPLSIKILLLQILELLFTNQTFVTLGAVPDRENVLSLRLVFSYIEDHYMEKISLEDLSSCLHMNRNYFCKYFREKVGKPPFAYLNEYRINQAAAQLLKSDLPITEVALNTGFDNMSYFIRQFKRYRGCTPSAFRRMDNLKAVPIL